MNAAEWNAKCRIGTRVRVDPVLVTRIKTTECGGDLGLPWDGISVLANRDSDRHCELIPYDEIVAMCVGDGPVARDEDDGTTTVVVAGVCGAFDARWVAPYEETTAT